VIAKRAVNATAACLVANITGFLKASSVVIVKSIFVGSLIRVVIHLRAANVR
jgi:hypothetical protein